jgi:hypothetical protein
VAWCACLKSAAVILLCSATVRGAVTLGQIETFSGTHDWNSGLPNPNPPALLADSGPLGTGDTALRVTSNGGSGAGGRLLVINESAWTGDYTGEGIVALAMHVRNGGTTPLSMRVALNGPGGWFVTAASPVAAFSGWNQLVFPIGAPSLVSSGGTDAGLTLSGVTEIRILHNATVNHRGAQLSSSFQVDNIQAIPEASVPAWIALAGGFLLRRHRLQPN